MSLNKMHLNESGKHDLKQGRKIRETNMDETEKRTCSVRACIAVRISLEFGSEMWISYKVQLFSDLALGFTSSEPRQLK